MINFDDVTGENIEEHNANWSQFPDHPYKLLIIGGFGSGKTNALLKLTKQQPDTEKVYLYAKDPYDTKYQMLMN